MPHIDALVSRNDDAASAAHLPIANVLWREKSAKVRPGILQAADVTSTAASQAFLFAVDSLLSGRLSERKWGGVVADEWRDSVFFSGFMTYHDQPAALTLAHTLSRAPESRFAEWQRPVFLHLSLGFGISAEGPREGVRESFSESLRAFRSLVSASGSERDRAFRELLAKASPAEVYEAAEQEFASRGGEIRLALAASALAEYGHRAVDVLRKIASDPSRNAEYFVYSAANLRGFSQEQRRELVSGFLASPHVDVKARALEALEILSNTT